MLHANLILQIPFFFHFAVLFLDIRGNLIQIMIDQVNRRQCIQNARRILIDLTDAGHQPKRRHREDCQLRQIIDNIRLPEIYLNNNRKQKPRHTHGFHDIFRQDGDYPADAQSSGKPCIIALVLINKILFPVQNLNLLDTSQRLVHPLEDHPSVALVLLSKPSRILLRDKKE